MALAAMIISIFSLLSYCFWPFQIALGVTGIVLVIFSKRGGKSWNGFAITDPVMSIIAPLISIAFIVYTIIGYVTLKDPQMASLMEEIYKIYGTAPIQ